MDTLYFWDLLMWKGIAQINFQERNGINCSQVVPNKQLSMTWLDFLRVFIATGYKYSTKIYFNHHNIPYYFQMKINFSKIFKYRLKLAHSIGEFLVINNNRLVLDASFFGLDQSERGKWSYMLGMIFTKFVSEYEYGVIYLQNLDYAITTNVVSVYNFKGNNIRLSNSRPDFIGQDLNGNWVVFEAKGHLSGNSGLSLLREAKNQARTIRCIEFNGTKVSPSLCIGSILTFNNYFNIETCDPPFEGNLFVNIKNYSKFIYYYYKFILDFFKEEKEKGKIVKKKYLGVPFQTAEIFLSNRRYRVGIYTPLFNKLIEVEKSDFKEKKRERLIFHFRYF